VFLDGGYSYSKQWRFLNILIHVEGEMESGLINKINEYKNNFSTHERSFRQFSFPQITRYRA
jgi:hypothetical protein